MSEGYCPKCGAGVEVDFRKVDLGFEGLTIPIECGDCGFKGYEQHTASFCCHLNGDGGEVGYDGKGNLIE